MEFSLKINCDNAAFQDNEAEEIARILEEVAARFRNGVGSGNIRDINGNTCGTFNLA